ncbi:protein BREAST CANCER SUSCEPTIBILITY 1 homolog isoform X1 [Lolium perenne]|uniref:protein BREAST CANCER SUSCEPTIBILITY 1 homolog isoform X1 n=1 Tax=Lolium perenne TaxID=4522 RepID=UPI0021F54C58|nr:protein BREAST CANCER SUSCEPTIBILITY 1 homolog isoform X1 [Lolium perenne]
MSCGGGRPPPGFGPAAAGWRPLGADFRDTKSATRTSTMVNIKTETDDGNLEVLQQRQMQNEAMASQSSCQTKPSLAGNNASPGVNASNTKIRNSLGKDGKFEVNEGTTGLRPPTPINLFEDECVFCHSFRTSEEFHGPMVQYQNGRIVSTNEGNPTNTIYVHKKCMYWAPRVYLNGDIIVNMEKEISRASRLKCSRCNLPGAALGCYNEPCGQTYHVPCARMMVPKCRWDVKYLNVLCPKHKSDPLPGDESSPIMESNISSPILRNQYLDKQVMHVIYRREDQQVDQLNTSSSSLPQGQYSDIEGISADYQREEKQTKHSRTPVNQWVLLGSVLSASEKDSLKEFASLTNSTLVEEWDKNVTHVIVGRGADSKSLNESYEVLMATLSGKWVVTAGWIVDCLVEPIPRPKTCLAEPIPGPEISYEVTSIDGPKKGRAEATEMAPKLFSGLHFLLSAYMKPEDTGNIKDLIVAAEGQVLDEMSPCSLQENLDRNPAKVYFVYASTYCLDLGKEMEEAVKYQDSGAQVISEWSLYGAIAAYDVRILERIST